MAIENHILKPRYLLTISLICMVFLSGPLIKIELFPKHNTEPPKDVSTGRIVLSNWNISSSCSNSFLRKFVQENHRYPDNIVWDKNKTLFHLSVCRLIELASVEECLLHKSISTIAVYGDSQGWRYGHALRFHLNHEKMPCIITAEEKRHEKEPDLEYLSRGDNQLRARMLPASHSCSGCSGFRAKCTSLTTNKTVNIEYIDTEDVMTNYVTLRAGNGSKAVSTFEKFLFEVYLKDSFPDLNVFFIPMNHIKRKPMKHFKDNFPRLLSVIKANKPPNSEVFVISGTAESDKGRAASYLNRRFHGLLANDAIEKLNSELFAMLESDIVNATSKIYSFLNLMDVTLPVLCWSKDGVHFEREWYAAFWKSFFNIYCID
ncbi:hypothetical protein CAPTEDRAFT_210601 [Capitella teleta]|uniref:Uncharacterized protein n=1 Tax=Capitella teleta TaxID=283909 RepID=R7U7V5_CAPTE|nr:hypothetical protein CAPTEDRAFT_210601 [Capitella teleta]|eukprot:ELT99756.1 hypothetical protein CAPTEDRAFT_210601 [Capitella teleta]